MSNKYTGWVNQHVAGAIDHSIVGYGNVALANLVPPRMQPYYQMVQNWNAWLTSKLPSFHDNSKGIVPTFIGRAVCDKLSDLIVGDGVLFLKRNDTEEAEESIGFITNEVEEKTSLQQNIKDSILMSVYLGEGYLKLNVDNTGNVWVDTTTTLNTFVDTDSRGRAVKSQTMVDLFTMGTIKKGGYFSDSFGLFEERYYRDEIDEITGKVERRAFGRYSIYRLPQANNSFVLPFGQGIKYEDLPRSVQEEFRHNYATVILNKEIPLPFVNIGIFTIKHTSRLSSLLNLKRGESALQKIINELMYYDLTYSENYLDIELTRPKLFGSKRLGSGKEAVNTVYQTLVDGISDEEQKPLIFNPTPRIEYYIKAREEICKIIANKVGVAASQIFSDIHDTKGQVTATQISSEESNTTLWQTNKRMLILPELNNLIKTILIFYGKPLEVKVEFAEAGSSNRTVEIDNVTRLIDKGLISQYQAIKRLNPKWSEEQIDAEIEKINIATEKAKSELFGNLNYDNNEGDFVNEEENTTGEEAGAELAGIDTGRDPNGD